MKELQKKTIAGFKWSYLNMAIKIISQLVIVSILAHLLEPKDFGLLSISFIFVNFSEMFSRLGIGPALIQKKEINDKHIRAGFTLILFLGFIFSVFLWILSPIIASFFNNSLVVAVLRWVCLIYIIRSFGVISRSLLQRKLRFKEIMIIDISGYIIGYGFIGIILASFGFGVWALVIAALFSSLISSMLNFYFSPHSLLFYFSSREIKDLLNFGGGFTLLSIFNYIARNGDNFIVGKFLGSAELGIYSRAYALMTMPATYFSSVLDGVLFPAMSRIQENNLKLRKIMFSGIELNAFLSLIVAIYVFFLSNDIILILLGKKWVEAIPVLRIMSLGVLFRSGYKINDSIIRAKGAVYRGAIRHGVYAFLVIVGTFLGSFYGLKYVAVGVVIALLFHYLFMASLSLGLTASSWKEFYKSHFHPLKLSVVLGVFFYLTILLFSYVNLHIFAHFVLVIILNFMFLLSLLIFFSKKIIDDNTKWILQKIFDERNPYSEKIRKILKY